MKVVAISPSATTNCIFNKIIILLVNNRLFSLFINALLCCDVDDDDNVRSSLALLEAVYLRERKQVFGYLLTDSTVYATSVLQSREAISTQALHP